MLLSLLIGVFAQKTEAATPTMIWVDGPTENFTCKKNLWIYGWVLSQAHRQQHEGDGVHHRDLTAAGYPHRVLLLLL